MGRISEETIQAVAAATDIVELVGSYLPLKRAGSAFKGLCPFHREKTPSLTVNPQRQTFHCFGCGAGGSAFRFVMEYEHLDFVSAVRKLAERAAIPVLEEAGGGGDDPGAGRIALLRRLHEEAAAFFESMLRQPAGEAARAYLKGRGIDGAIARRWLIGFAPDSIDAFCRWAGERGYAPGLLVEAGLAKPRDAEKPAAGIYDRFRNRIMFTICNDSGAPIAFSGRTLSAGDRVPKYINSPETPLFVKGRVAFGLHLSKRAIIDAGEVVLLEGQMDLISAFEAGVQNVAAPQGTALTPDQARLLRRYASGAVLCFDADAAGQKAAEKGFFPLLEAGFVVRVAVLPAGEDPDSLVRQRGVEGLREVLSGVTDFFDFQIARARESTASGDPRARLAASERLAASIAVVGDPVLREDALTRVAAAFEISAQALREKVAGAASRSRQFSRGAGAGVRPHAAGLAVEPAGIRPPEPIHILCLIALHHPPAHEWLRTQPWPEILAEAQGARPLEVLLGAACLSRTDGRGVLPATGEDPALEKYYAALLTEKPPSDPLALAERWWRLFALGTRLASKQATMEGLTRRVPPAWDEIACLKKEILDLQRELRDVDFPGYVPG